MRGAKTTFTTRFVLLVGILLFVANTALGLVILNQSTSAMRALISKDMLDVVKSAAGSLDGDVMAALTEDDMDTPVVDDIKERLLVFQRSVDIHFIYAVKQLDADTYVFTVDPDPVDPGAFGEEIVTTPALVAAAQGVPTVDDNPAADRWGNFYSAYSPIFDSSGKVAGVVGVDFDAQWYDEQVRGYTWSIAVVTSLSVLLGGAVVALISSSVRRKFSELDAGLSELSDDVDVLMREMAAYSGLDAPVAAEAGAPEVAGESEDPSAEAADELEVLGGKIRTMQSEMGMYLDYLHRQAYTDALTKVGNSTAYHEAVRALDERVVEGDADFCVVVFDLNSLKELNDTFGHECGDYYIQGAARAVSAGLGEGRTFRIGGDEFAVLAEGLSDEQLAEGLAAVDEAIRAFNDNTSYPAALSVSRGSSRFDPEADLSFKDVFARADHAMYEDKREFYRRSGTDAARVSDGPAGAGA